MADLGSLLGGLGVGGNIGKAIVQLELDTAKYTAEMEAAQAKTTATTGKLGGTFSKFGGIASTAFLAAGAAAVAGLGMSVKAAIEAQEAQERLHNTIQNAPQLGANAEQAFLDLAESIRKTTGADDEAIISGEALLGNMGLLQGQITTLAPLVVDLATKYDIDLQAAFKAVGKAATGSTGALSRYVGTIEKGATPAETLQNVLTKLGGAAGFAAQQAKNEPWRLLQSDLEEVSEDIGTALLPAIESLARSVHNLIPLIEGLANAIKYLPLIQMSEDIGTADNALSKFVNVIIDSIPALGSFVDLKLGKPVDALAEAVVDATGKSERFTGIIQDQKTALEQNARRGAFMAERLGDVAKATKKAGDEFEYADVTLEDLADATKVSERAFEQYFRTLNRQSKDLRQVARELQGEKWVNQDFIDFLSTKGPEWLIRFGDETERQQRKVQTEWEKSNERTKKANENLSDVQKTLDGLDKSNTKHTVEIHYKYVGFDPSKPGMATSGSNQQR